jgi:hypothetical protein
MKKVKYKSFFLPIICLLLSTSLVKADRELVIATYRQWGNKTCWAAVSVMVLNAYGFPQTDEKKVRCWAFPIPNENNCDCSLGGMTDTDNNLYGAGNSVEGILYEFGTISGKDDDALAPEEISGDINGGRPFICGLLNDDYSKHMVLARGYRGNGGSNVTKVIYNNPSSGQRVEQDYTDFTVNSSFAWLETFRLTTNPRKAIPVGMYDWCRISDGGTTIITPSTTSLSYTAGFYDGDSWPTDPVSWDWKLIFVHSSGACIARSWTVTSAVSDLTWYISGFSLPSGYQWYYNYFGNIIGRIELDLLDSDGYHHLDAIDIQYTPNNPYFGNIVYENQTVSSAQPEVKAHQTIITQNDQFISGGNITFRSGERIDIKDGITIQNGGTTNFVTDPSVR